MKNIWRHTLVLLLAAALIALSAALSASSYLPQLARLPSTDIWSGLEANPPLLQFPALARSLIAQTRTAAQNLEGSKLVIGDIYTLPEDETLEGSLFIIGGSAILEPGSRVEGDVVMLGGLLQVGGAVEGDIVAVSGLVDLQETALVIGDVNTVAGNLERAEGARVEGEVNTNISGPFPFTIPTHFPPSQVQLNLNPLWKGLWILFRSFIWTALAVLAILFLPLHIERTTHAIVSAPLIAGGLGFLTALVAPIVLVILAITILCSPLALIGAVLLTLAWALGIIALGTEVGTRLAKAIRQEWSSVVAAGVGVFLLALIVNIIQAVVPCIGWVAPFLVGVLGLGAVILTRFGSQPYLGSTLHLVSEGQAEIGTDSQTPEDQPASESDKTAEG